jgi:hypothetical protein
MRFYVHRAHMATREADTSIYTDLGKCPMSNLRFFVLLTSVVIGDTSSVREGVFPSLR